MKIKALRRFEDFKEKVTREIGDEFEVTKARFEEIKKGLAKFGEGDWVEEVKEEVEGTDETTDETTEEIDLSKLTNGKLKEILDEKGIEYKKNMTKGELIELIGE